MATDPNKTVFISYRRTVSKYLARSIYMDLTHNGYDVFLDVSTIDNGAFDSVILNQIGARTHFILLLSAGALERCQHADDWLRREIEEALSLKRNIVPIIEEGFNFETETVYLPVEWRDEFKRISVIRLFYDYFDEAMERLRGRYLKQPDFPVDVKRVSKKEQTEVEQRKAQLLPPSIPDFLPQPFEWCYIPAGKVTIGYGDWKENQYIVDRAQNFDIPDFFMAKYPITNAQYQVFVDAKDGYADANWWSYSDGARAWRNDNPQPQNTAFQGDNHPRTNITWYESVAFTLWISQRIGLNIHLPTEQQWQLSAIGDTNFMGFNHPRTNITWYQSVTFTQWISKKTNLDIRLPTEHEWQQVANGGIYPYGRVFDQSKCNFNSNGTTPVTHYPDGMSPYGVVDMSGNVWEWCLTEASQGNTLLKEMLDKQMYVLKGGSWWDDNVNYLSADVRVMNAPNFRYYNRGFRIACSLSP